MKKFLGKVGEKLDSLDLKRSSNGSFSNTASASLAPPPPPTSQPPSPADIYRHRKQRGVNIGSWFSLESWLTPSLFQRAVGPRGSEHDVVLGMSNPESKAMLENHWDRFVDDGDWRWMKGHGINTVRLPISYYHFLPGHPDPSVRDLLKGTDFERFEDVYSGALSRILRAIETAKSHGMGVLVDLHSAPGKQNLDGHSGTSSNKAALWESSWLQTKTIQILVALANTVAGYENVVGLEVLNEPKNSGRLQSFYEEAIRAIRSSSPQASALPLYLGDAWDTNHYTGFVGQQTSPASFLVNDYHLYRCFTKEDHATRAEEHARRCQPDENGGGQTAAWLSNMSNRCGGSLVIGEWSAALNPSSLSHLRSEEEQRQTKAYWAHSQWLAFERHCSGYFFWTLKKEGGPDTGWCFYTAVEHGVLPASLSPHSNVDLEAVGSKGEGLLQQAFQAHCSYWDPRIKDGSQHFRFQHGFRLAWEDSLHFARHGGAEIGFGGQWMKTRLASHVNEKGPDGAWEFEHGYMQGLCAFKTAL
ncbi:glycoside hydrolase [Violaceomyces palustris]|uniref:Glycoside hydrolase n=1 Tax=Violaceomyces palustris TaxID=1673888 RepID=A0ACD0NPK0_9BASI|nr:glycoside hydrolase [Violaceomyces palustris]